MIWQEEDSCSKEDGPFLTDSQPSPLTQYFNLIQPVAIRTDMLTFFLQDYPQVLFYLPKSSQIYNMLFTESQKTTYWKTTSILGFFYETTETPKLDYITVLLLATIVYQTININV